MAKERKYDKNINTTPGQFITNKYTVPKVLYFASGIHSICGHVENLFFEAIKLNSNNTFIVHITLYSVQCKNYNFLSFL